MELKNLLNDMDVYTSRLEELLVKIEEKLKEIPYVDKLMGIKGSAWQQSADSLRRWETLDVLPTQSSYRSWRDMRLWRMIPEA